MISVAKSVARSVAKNVRNGALLNLLPVIPDGTPTSTLNVTDTAFDVISSVSTNSSTVVTLEYGTATGVYTNTVTAAESPVLATGDVNFSLTGLSPYTDYYFRVKAVNSAGTAYSQEFLQQTDSIAEVKTYITGLTTPLSATEIALLNTLAASLKSVLNVTSLDQRLDYLNVRAGETAEQSLRNFVKRAHDSTAVNSPTFTAGQGFTGNGTSSYIEIDYIPANGTRYQLNDASHGLYFRNFDRGSLKYNGCTSTQADGGNNNRLTISSLNSTNLTIGINNSVNNSSNSDVNGLYILNRLNASEFNWFRNNVKSTNIALASTKRPNQKIIELAVRNDQGQVVYHNTSQISYSFCGAGLTDAEVDGITDAFKAYMTAKGTNVIP